MEGVIGFATTFAGNFAPTGWALCQGQLLSIASNTALFSILGTTYGGNGQTTFGLPDLRGRMVIGNGQGPGLSSYVLGEQSGVETVTLSMSQMPSHVHTTQVTISPAAATNAINSSPVNGVYANGTEQLYNSTGDTTMKPYQKIMVMITDASIDMMEKETDCGSFSFCAARTGKYPDRRPLGYPFNRPFTGANNIMNTIRSLDNAACRTIFIKHQ